MSSGSPERTPSYNPRPAVPYTRSIASSIPELARALSDEERRKLLLRISQSLSMHQRSEEQIVHGELRKERRQDIIRADMESLSGWDRFLFWLKKMFSGSGEESAFVSFRLDKLKEHIGTKQSRYIDFELRTAETEFAQIVRKLYTRVQPVIPLFQTLWKDEDTLRRIVDTLLSIRIPDARNTLNQFITTQELQDEFRKTESRGRLKQIVMERISAYIDSMHPDAIRQVEEGILPAYFLKDIVLFDYGNFFSAFQTDLATVAEKDEPQFQRVSLARILPQLETLHLALHNAERVSTSVGVFPELLEYYIRMRQGVEDPGEGLNGSSISPEAEAARRSLVALRKTVQEVKQSLPLVEIIRFAKEDPYYRFMAYVPRLRLKDFYYANLKMEMLQTLDDRFHDLRTGVVGRMIQDLFREPMKEFEYYHPGIRSTVQRAGVSALNNYQTLQIIRNFIEQVYRASLHDFMRIIGRIIPARSRDAVSDLTLFLAGLDDIAERLSAFDRAFSPSSDEGKTLYRYRFSAERDSQQQAVFRALVNQLDREGLSIIEKFLEQSRGIKEIFLAIRRSSHEHLNERYAGFKSGTTSKRPFDDMLDYHINAVELGEKIVGQMIVIEAER